MAETEAERFWDFDRPDLYFPFYPDLYGGRMGTLVPFNFRLLLAELPAHNGKHRDALTRLHSVLAIVRKVGFLLNVFCLSIIIERVTYFFPSLLDFKEFR